MVNKIFLFLTIFTMLAIFIFSSQNEEKTYELSGNVTKAVNNAASKLTANIKVVSEENIEVSVYDKYVKKYLTEFYIRKAAHIFLYILLTITLIGFFYTLNIIKKPVFSILIAFIAAFIYSLTDEFHQSFINGRQNSFRDILIDLFGAVIGIIIFMAGIKIINIIKYRHL